LKEERLKSIFNKLFVATRVLEGLLRIIFKGFDLILLRHLKTQGGSGSLLQVHHLLLLDAVLNEEKVAFFVFEQAFGE
jgi:hypothetical protein